MKLLLMLLAAGYLDDFGPWLRTPQGQAEQGRMLRAIHLESSSERRAIEAARAASALAEELRGSSSSSSSDESD